MPTPSGWTEAAAESLRRRSPSNHELARHPHWVCPDCGDPCACQGTDLSAHRRCGNPTSVQLPLTEHHDPGTL